MTFMSIFFWFANEWLFFIKNITLTNKKQLGLQYKNTKYW